MLGSGAMTNSIEDVTRKAEVIMLVGSNPEEAHPVIGMQIRAAVERGCRLIAVDPRDIGLAAHADIHLKLRPGTNVAFANGIVNYLIQHELYDEDFVRERTEGFEILAATVRDYTPELVEDICGIDRRDLVAAAKMYAAADAAAIMYCLGVTEHSTGTDGVMALSNIAMISGNLGKPGGGVNPLRGQNNVQGACDMGAGPDDLPGYQKVADPEVVRRFEKAWGVALPRARGIKATECFPAMIEGGIKGLFLFGEDPVRTDPDTHHVIRSLEALEFFVVDDLFMTETAKYADVILPGRSYAEKEGTFTNTERRVQRVRKAVDGPVGAWLDTDIFTEVMNRMGYAQPRLSAAEVMDEIVSVTPTYGGMSHARLDGDETAGRGLQWPCPSAEHPGTPILHMGEFAQGLGAFSTPDYQPSAELPEAEYPLVDDDGSHPVPVQRLCHDRSHRRRERDSEPLVHRAEHVRCRGSRHRRRGHRARLIASRLHRVRRACVREDVAGTYVDAVPFPRRQQQLAHHRRPRPRVEGPRVQGVRRESGKGVRKRSKIHPGTTKDPYQGSFAYRVKVAASAAPRKAGKGNL